MFLQLNFKKAKSKLTPLTNVRSSHSPSSTLNDRFPKMVRQRRLNVRKTPYRLRSQAKCVKMLLQQYQYRQAVAIAMTVHIRYLRRQLLWLRITVMHKNIYSLHQLICYYMIIRCYLIKIVFYCIYIYICIHCTILSFIVTFNLYY